jgi:hypothetical protein
MKLNLNAMCRLIPILLLYCSMAGAATVYRSVDENGVVTFSDTPPEAGVEADTLQIDTPAPQNPQQHLDNLEAMRETTDRMAADRREREKHRAEMRELAARSQANQPPLQPDSVAYTDYYPAYSGRRHRPIHRPPMRPGYRPRPEHPIARPPLKPGYQSGTWTNSQLMRPLVSSRPN